MSTKIKSKICTSCKEEKENIFFYVGKNKCVECYKKEQNDRRRQQTESLKLERINREMEEHMINININENCENLLNLNSNLIKTNDYIYQLDKFIVKTFLRFSGLTNGIVSYMKIYDDWADRIVSYFSDRVVQKNVKFPRFDDIVEMSELPKIDMKYDPIKKISTEINNLSLKNVNIKNDIDTLKNENQNLKDEIQDLKKTIKNDIDTLKDENQNLKKEIQDFKKTIRNDIDALKKQNLKNENQNLKNEIEDLKKNIQNDIDTFKNQHFKNEIEDLKKTIKNMEFTIQKIILSINNPRFYIQKEQIIYDKI